MESSDHEQADDSRLARILEAGADIAGSVSGVTTGFVVAGPPGAFAGAAAGSAVAAVIKDIVHRVLSHREEKRLGGVYLAASAAFDELLASGATLRTDSFFDTDVDERSSAEEVFEGVFLAAKAEHQERKIPYLGYLMANIAFDETIDASLANWTVTTAEDLTWTQFVLLAAIGRKAEFNLPDGDYGEGMTAWNQWGVHNQLAELGITKREMIGAAPRKTERMNLPIFNVSIHDQELRRPGLLMFQLLGLDRVPAADIEGVLAALTVEPPA